MEFELNPKQRNVIEELQLKECLERLVKKDFSAAKEMVEKLTKLNGMGFYLARATADVLGKLDSRLREEIYKVTREMFSNVFHIIAPFYENTSYSFRKSIALIEPRESLEGYCGVISCEYYPI